MSTQVPTRTADLHLTCLSNVPCSPKWTFGGRTYFQKASVSPGPGEYDSTIDPRSINSPKIGFGSEERGRSSVKFPGPAPGSYNPSDAGRRNPPQWSIAGRQSAASVPATPDPGAYHTTVEDLAVAFQGKSYTFGSSSRKSMQMSSTPGPGSYNPANANFQALPCWSMGSAGKDKLYSVKSKSPGPGEYNPLSFQRRAPEYTFRAREESRKIQPSPGPGHYTPSRAQGERGYWSFGVKTNGISRGSNSPGPGAYHTDNTYSHSSGSSLPQWSFGTESRSHKQMKGSPGPGTYNPQKVSSRLSPVWGFGSAPQSVEFRKKDVPAPGTYNLSSSIGESAKYSWGNATRLDKSQRKVDMPGPGEYNPRVMSTFEPPQWGFAAEKRFLTAARTASPGPGQYDPRDNNASPQWTMVSRKDQAGLLSFRNKNAKIGSGKLPEAYTCFGY